MWENNKYLLLIIEIPEFVDKGLHVFKLHLMVLHLTSVTLSVLNSSLFEGVVVAVQIQMVGGLIQKEHLGLDKESSS